MNKAFALLFVSAIPLFAQSGPERVDVPLHDPSRPATLHVKSMSGSVSIRGADVKDVVVQAHSGHSHEQPEPPPAAARGMKRLDLPGSGGLDITEDNNVVTVKTGMRGPPADLTITVPRRSSLELKCMGPGEVNIEQVDGEIDANNLNGRVVLKNVSGSVIAHSLNGTVLAVIDRIDASKPMSFSTMNGDIDVSLPSNVKANVMMKTDQGEIFSDFDVKLNAPARVAPENGRQPDGTYHLRFEKALRGTINGGGPEYQFTTFNGQIYIRQKK